MLKDAEFETTVFLERVKLLGDKLGVLLLQFPPNFSVAHLPDLADYLGKLPAGFRYVVEVRDEGWFKPEFYALLRSKGVGLAWADSPLALPLGEVTAGFLYVRWEGDRAKVNGTLGKIEADRRTDLQVWADKLQQPFLAEGVEVFGYFGKYYSGYPPHDVAELSSFLSPERNEGQVPLSSQGF